LLAEAAPTRPVWPAQWHAEVVVGDSSFWSFSKNVGATGRGEYFYDGSKNMTAWHLTETSSGYSSHELILPTKVYKTAGPSGKVTVLPPNASRRYIILQPNFLASMDFFYVETEYHLRDNIFYETQHWKSNSTALGEVDYYHGIYANCPFRLIFGASYEPLIIDFKNVIAGLEDVPNLAYYFRVPSSSQYAQHAATLSQSAVAHSDGAYQDTRLQMKAMRVKPKLESTFAPGAPAPSGAKAWPLQWHGDAAYTGNQFGLVPNAPGVIGDPSLVPISLIGHYYYDSPGARECNTWVDAVTHELTKTLIVGGKFYIVYEATKTCLIVPIAPVNGPLKPEWPTRLPFLDSQYLWRDPAYLPASHHLLDAINTGTKVHAFQYWQSSDETPMQFQGPVLDFWPYGQSMMSWSQTKAGLEGVNLEDIFSLPNNCVSVTPAEFEKLRDPVSYYARAVRSMHAHFQRNSN
jgi:hypothetical protein